MHMLTIVHFVRRVPQLYWVRARQAVAADTARNACKQVRGSGTLRPPNSGRMKVHGIADEITGCDEEWSGKLRSAANEERKEKKQYILAPFLVMTI